MSLTTPTTTPSTTTRTHAIIAFAIGALFFAYAFIQRVAPSVMTNELMRDFTVGGATLGTLSACYFYAYAAIQVPVGILNDRFGPRKLMSTAAAIAAIASFGFAASDSLLTASIFRTLIGASVAFAFVGTLTIASYWFPPARFTMLAGAIQTVGMCGAMLGQAPLRHAVELLGWRTTMAIIGTLAIALALLLFRIVPHRPHTHAPPTGDHHHPVFPGVHAVITNPQSWACAGIGFGAASTMLAFAGLWAVPWLSTVFAYPVSTAAAVVSLLFLGWAIGAPLMGWLSDHIGLRKPVLLIGALCNALIFSILLFATPHLPTLHAPFSMAIIFFTLGICGSTMTVAFGCMREVNSRQHGATAMGLFNMCVVAPGALLQPLIGWLLDLAWHGTMLDGARIYTDTAYTTALTVLLGANALALGCIMVLRETHCRPLITPPSTPVSN